MQKAQKRAIKLCLILFISSINYSHAQINDDAYYLLDKIIQLTKQPNDSIYELSSRNDIGKGFLKNYYEFRTKDRPFFKFFEIDSVTDEVGFDSIRLKNDMLRWKAKYRVLIVYLLKRT